MNNKIELIKTNDIQGMIENANIEKGVKAHNDTVSAVDADFINRMNQRTKSSDQLELLPYGSKLVVKPYGYNPYAKIETTENGLIIGGQLQPFHKSNETGNVEPDEQGIWVCQVIEVGPDVKYAREGDDIFVFKSMCKPLPFFNHGFYIVLEQNVDTFVNIGLSKRVEEIKK